MGPLSKGLGGEFVICQPCCDAADTLLVVDGETLTAPHGCVDGERTTGAGRYCDCQHMPPGRVERPGAGT